MSQICQGMTARLKAPAAIGLAVLASSIFSTTQVQAEDKQNLVLNGFVSLNSQIRSRGISLTDESPSYMLNLNLIDKSGLYGSIYAFGVDGLGTYGGEDMEVDYLLGYGTQLGSVAVDGGMGLYHFPGTIGTSFNEFYLSGSKKIQDIESKLGLMYVPDRQSVGGHDKLYVYADVSKPIASLPLTAKAHIGYTSGKGNIYAGPTGEFIDYSLGVDYTWKQFIVNATYIGTTIDKAKADVYFALPNAKKGSDMVGNSLMASVTYLF
jgi:uncharacterized protein (TIGR02001 family)